MKEEGGGGGGRGRGKKGGEGEERKGGEEGTADSERAGYDAADEEFGAVAVDEGGHFCFYVFFVFGIFWCWVGEKVGGEEVIGVGWWCKE